MCTRINGLIIKLIVGFLIMGFSNYVFANSFRFPHYATGGGYTMELIVNNFSQNTANINLNLYDHFGTLQAIPWSSGQTSGINLILPPGASKTLTTTDADATMLTGYVTVDTDQDDVSGVIVFKYTNGAEVSVLPEIPGKKFSLMVEKSATIDFGIAVLLESSTQPPITLKLYDSQGIMQATHTWNMASGLKQEAKYLTELFKIGNFQGSVVLESEDYFTCFGLRLGTGTYTMSSVPVFDPRTRLDPTIIILSPTTESVFTTASGIINIGGTVTDSNRVISVVYSNDRGDGGTATGTNNWSASVVLQPGTNIITVMVTDAMGNGGQAKLTVIYAPPAIVTNVNTSCSPTTIQSGQTSQCSATVQGTGNYNSAVTWATNVGTISNNGVLTAPSVTTTTVVTVRATSVQDSTKSSSMTVTVNPIPSTITKVTVSCSPTTIQSGQTSQCSATVQGSGSYNPAVTWTTTAGTISISGLLTASTVATATSVTVSAKSVQDTTKSNSTTVTVNPIPSSINSVSISCSPTTIQSGQTSQCSATVQGSGSFNPAVTWTTTAGTISTSGLFTAPTVATAMSVTVSAKSVQDPAIYRSATVTISVSAFLKCSSGGSAPQITLNVPPGASYVSGTACNIDTSKIKVVFWAETNQWYVQPYDFAPFTDISSNGSWSSYTHPWNTLVATLVDPTKYSSPATLITNPALDPNVLAWVMYPTGPASVNFSGYTWGIKTTGNGQVFDPGPNSWSNSPSVVSVQADGLHLKISKINGIWNCGEVYLLSSLGYGTYTTRINSSLDNLNLNTVAAPLFIYASTSQELDYEFSGSGGLIPGPYNAQIVVQPYTVPGNMVRYVQPSMSQFTTQIEWRSDHVTFTSWNGSAATPAPGDIIYQWTYRGPNIPSPGSERVRSNLWLLNGAAPTNGVGDEMIISSFTFNP
jgi:hypothetical protein